jgi:thiol-disulfide isomerase/thioredoxin
MLDFWATWCGPCREEIPYLVKAYQKYHSRGLEVLGISLDQENKAEAVRKFLNENHMPWPQVYDGKYWQAAVAQQYSIDSIPAAFLVDGTSGKIIAEGEDIRGDELDPAIAKALAGRK